MGMTQSKAQAITRAAARDAAIRTYEHWLQLASKEEAFDHAIAEYLIAATDQSPMSNLKWACVIPLKWTDHPAGGKQAVGARLGLYRVHRNGDDWYLGQDHMGKGGEDAASAHYERCILSAIATT